MSAMKLDTEIRQEQITQAALSLIASDGLKGLSVARIALRVGIVPSAIYRHFKSKDEVIDGVLDFIRDRLLGNVDAVCVETREPLERLRLLLMRHVKLIRENQAIPRIIFSEDVYGGHPDRRAKVYRIIWDYLNQVGELIGQGQKEGRMRSDINTETAALMFLGIIQPAAILWHMSNGSFNITKHTEKAWEIFIKVIEAN